MWPSSKKCIKPRFRPLVECLENRWCPAVSISQHGHTVTVNGDNNANEIFITVATFAAMMLLYTLFAKFVPIISIWEMKAGDHQPSEVEAERVHAVAEGRLEETHA